MNKKIQVLRAFAIIGVVLIHTCTNIYVRPFINYSVALFIFCSGYLTKSEIPNIMPFYKKRIVKLIAPYVIWSIVYSILFARLSLIQFAKDFLTGRCNSIFYFFLVYVQLVVLTPLCCKLLKSKYKWVGFVVTPLYIIVCRYVPALCGITLGWPFPETLFCGWFSYYFLGMALSNGHIEYNSGWIKTGIFYVVGLGISEFEAWFWISKYGNFDLGYSQIRMSSLISSTGAMLLAFLYLKSKSREFAVVQRGLCSIGNVSFGIFLSHVLFMTLLEKTGYFSDLHFAIKALLVLTVSYAFCVCLRYIFKWLHAEKICKYMGL